jgi:hypothetical protein
MVYPVSELYAIIGIVSVGMRFEEGKPVQQENEMICPRASPSKAIL